MRRLLHWVAKLYPKAWRKRYGDEFEAMVEQMEPRWSDVLNVAARSLLERSVSMKAWQWIAAGALVGVGAHLATLFVHHPDGYRSTAVLYVRGETPERAEERLRLIEHSLLTRTNFVNLVVKYNLFRSLRRRLPLEDVIADFVKGVEIKQVAPRAGQAASFVLSVHTDEADTAQKVARDLIEQLIDGHLQAKIAAGGGGMTMEVTQVPSMERRPVRWMNAERILGYGALFGALCGGVVVAGLWGWRRWRVQ